MKSTLVERQHVHDTVRVNTGYGAEGFAQPIIESFLRCSAFIFGRRKVETKRENVLRLVAGIDVRQCRKAPEHQPRGNEQEQRKGYFGHGEDVSHPSRCRLNEPCPESFEPVHEIDSGRAKGGDESNEDRGDNGDAEIETEHRSTETDVLEERKVRWPQEPQHADPPIGDEGSDGTSGKSVDYALEENPA